MINTDSIIGLINQIVISNFRYSVPREGQVKSIKDESGKGRILVVIPSLGWDTKDKGAWCYSTDKNSLTTVKVDDWVIVQFLDGNKDYPIIVGKSTRIKDQTPESYEDETTQIIFEDPNDHTIIKYDGEELKIGLEDFKDSARVDDAVKVIIPAGTVIVAVSGGSGSPAVGTANATDIELDGVITEGSEKVKVGTK